MFWSQNLIKLKVYDPHFLSPDQDKVPNPGSLSILHAMFKAGMIYGIAICIFRDWAKIPTLSRVFLSVNM